MALNGPRTNYQKGRRTRPGAVYDETEALRETGASLDVGMRRCYSGAQLKTGQRTLKPNKLIISRKGFDSGSGGRPSPIFADDTMFSLQIP